MPMRGVSALAHFLRGAKFSNASRRRAERSLSRFMAAHGPLTQSHESFPVWVRYEPEVGHIDLRMAVETWQITHGIVT